MRQILSAHLIHPEQGLTFPLNSPLFETFSTSAEFRLWTCLNIVVIVLGNPSQLKPQEQLHLDDVNDKQSGEKKSDKYLLKSRHILNLGP